MVLLLLFFFISSLYVIFEWVTLQNKNIWLHQWANYAFILCTFLITEKIELCFFLFYSHLGRLLARWRNKLLDVFFRCGLSEWHNLVKKIPLISTSLKISVSLLRTPPHSGQLPSDFAHKGFRSQVQGGGGGQVESSSLESLY